MVVVDGGDERESGCYVNNSELMEDLVQQKTLHSVSDLKDFVELHYGELLLR